MPAGSASSGEASAAGSPLENPAFLTAPQAIFPRPARPGPARPGRAGSAPDAQRRHRDAAHEPRGHLQHVLTAIAVLPTEELFVYVYVLVHDLMLARAIVVPGRPGPAPACSDAELLAIAVVRHLPGRRNKAGFLAEVGRDWGQLFPVLPCQSEANRRTRWLWRVRATSNTQHLVARCRRNRILPQPPWLEKSILS